ncbi:hypothetical protein C8R48DRAFT_698834 [Suillus tomentosus]|nr:hypothetical protein C8R48DRAFT_698834 [Suillus tomentosus]
MAVPQNASEHDSFDEADKKVSHYQRPNKLCRTFAMQDVNIMLPNSDHEQTDVDSDDAQRNVHAGADSDRDTGVNDSELEEDDNDLDAAARMLSDEVASLVTNNQKPQKSSKVSDSGADRLTPTWGDVDDTVSESIESTTTGGELSISSDNEGAVKAKLVRTSATKSITLLVRTEKGKVKLLDQNLPTRQVIQAAISEVKCHVMFVHGYPELVEKNQLSTQTLLTVTEKRGMDAIKERLQVDELYALQLGALLVYIYAMKFDVSNNATPIRNRPYQGELLILLISNQLFHSSRAIGVKFASRFVEIAKNKLKRPEIPIPLLALVATAVYSALLWKSLGSPGKFNFSGNQFSEVYSYHVKSLEQLKHDAPGKFHYMMADIYEAAQ